MSEEMTIENFSKNFALEHYHKIGSISDGSESTCSSLFERELDRREVDYTKNIINDLPGYIFHVDTEKAGNIDIVCIFVENIVKIICPFVKNKQCVKSSKLLDCINDINDKNIFSKFVISNNSIIAAYTLSFTEYFFADFVMNSVFKLIDEVDQSYVEIMKTIYGD